MSRSIELSDAILSAMDSLPPGSTLHRINNTAGRKVGRGFMGQLKRLGLVVEGTAGYSLTEAGRERAAMVRMTQHPSVYTPEMAAPVPVGSVWDRISRADLEQAVAAGHSVRWMTMKFDASEASIRMLLQQYGLEAMHIGA